MGGRFESVLLVLELPDELFHRSLFGRSKIKWKSAVGVTRGVGRGRSWGRWAQKLRSSINAR